MEMFELMSSPNINAILLERKLT
ncbi:hypothetical protein F383_34246 [Gossypium arboreum]|uniref:Uncharacterized protein n=1 Tax=Gossypium arboreum TaxID=29729 RepID=A0A0B0MGM5_GOSAR|nr:hypothetical protein F383_37362 [Gossypium arboreum]KHG07286.1 hypothetical protein F383_34246 [Gossypium arboreum]